MTWSIDAMRFDGDVYRRFAFTRGSVAAGASLAALDLDLDGFSPRNANYEAVGIGLFVDGRHNLYESSRLSCALIGRGRWSQLMGKHAYDRIFTILQVFDVDGDGIADWDTLGLVEVTARQQEDANLQVAEATAGLELVRKFRHASLAFEYAVEIQQWKLTPSADLSFLGSTFAVSLQR